ncbi:MAG: hypothetical protein ISR75_06150 [Phycisphaerales bacterium]|nr:hypothetical protein [Planctomycetota bacterium]MBL6998002.1 hypothetical protein [Phycisphaerales bacterium]
MNYRKVATLILFYSLGIAALSGILAVFLPNTNSIIPRLLVTAIVTAITAALLLFAIQRIEIEKTRLFGGSLGIVTCAAYLLTLGSIWIGYAIRTVQLSEQLGLSALLVSGCGALISIGFLGNANKRLLFAGYALSIIWCIDLLLWLCAIWLYYNQSGGQFFGYIAFPLQTLFPIIVLCFIRKPILYMCMTCTFAIASCIFAQVAMFLTEGDIAKDDTLFILTLICGGIGAFFGIANIIQFRAKKYAIRWAELGTLVIVSIAISTFCFNIWFEMNRVHAPDFIIRLAIGTGILSSTAILGLLIGQMLRGSVFTLYDGSGLQGICPRCNSTLQIPRGKSHCATCGLRMKVQIESPNCRACGYDITKIPEIDSCSECGEPIVLPSPVE